MDKNTFGDSPAAETLVKILERHPQFSRTASRLHHGLNYGLNQLHTVQDLGVRKAFFRFALNHYLESVTNSKLSDEVKTFLKNIMRRSYRKTLLECEYQSRMLKKLKKEV